eukprot:s839_g1.t1
MANFQQDDRRAWRALAYRMERELPVMLPGALTEIAETFAAASVTNEAICILGLGKLAALQSTVSDRTQNIFALHLFRSSSGSLQPQYAIMSAWDKMNAPGESFWELHRRLADRYEADLAMVRMMQKGRHNSGVPDVPSPVGPAGCGLEL